MIGAIAGDMVGSPYEAFPIKTTDFAIKVSRFTDDTVLTLAVADAILRGVDYGVSIKHFAQKYPDLPYGGSFRQWMWKSTYRPYNSYGNGSAMRVSPIGFAFGSIEEVLFHAEKSAAVTHNHPEGIKGAQATALAIFLARQGIEKEAIRSQIAERFSYDLFRTVDDIRGDYSFDVTCQGSVPESIIAFMDANNYETAVRNAISFGGDADTMACIAGGIAQGYYKKIPSDIVTQVRRSLPQDLWHIVKEFNEKYDCEY